MEDKYEKYSGDGKELKNHHSNEENQLEKGLKKQSEIASIFELTESRVKTVDSKKNEFIVKLIGGETIDLNQQKSLLAKQLQKHPPQFSLEFYTEVFKILNISEDPSKFRKPKEVADFTVELIYSRLNKDDFATILAKNRYVGFFRRGHWHYQFLNDEGIVELQKFIHHAITEMRNATSYYDFRKRMYEEHGVTYQYQLFD